MEECHFLTGFSLLFHTTQTTCPRVTLPPTSVTSHENVPDRQSGGGHFLCWGSCSPDGRRLTSTVVNGLGTPENWQTFQSPIKWHSICM